MNYIDLRYLCTAIGNLAGIPIRLYEGEELVFYHAVIHLPRDPMVLHQQDIREIRANVGYYVTRSFHYYGIVNAGTTKIVLGPTRQISQSEQELRELAFRLDIPQEDTADFVRGMKSIVPMPLESIMQILCTMNHVLNGEKLSLRDMTVYDPEAKLPEQPRGSEVIGPPQALHNTFQLEQTVMAIVQKGDTAALLEWTRSAPGVNGGILANEQLRQLKNTFIVTATLTSRAAIRGGMDIEDAFSLSDAFIQECELLNSQEQIMALQYRMVTTFTQRVEKIRKNRLKGKLAVEVAGYIHRHLSEPITAEAIAKELYLSRPYLSRRFIRETGESLTNFILKEKTEEAKRLLRYTDRSLTAVSSYLGFSSQSHFSRTFKRYAGISPGEYREKYRDSP